VKGEGERRMMFGRVVSSSIKKWKKKGGRGRFFMRHKKFYLYLKPRTDGEGDATQEKRGTFCISRTGQREKGRGRFHLTNVATGEGGASQYEKRREWERKKNCESYPKGKEQDSPPILISRIDGKKKSLRFI